MEGSRYGSDAVVDLLTAHGVEYVSFNPGASFRGLHDSLVNGPGERPAVVLCTHEGVAVAVAHGYAKAAGRPMAVALHNVVGLQTASMAIFNAWVDRVPMLLLGGTGPVSVARRRPWIDWIHTALVQGTQIRDYVKWDDQPFDLPSAAESIRRAFSTTLAAPQGPVYVCLDAGIQEDPAEALSPESLEPHPVPAPPAPDAAAISWLAEQCVTARMPVMVTDYAGDTEQGYAALLELAELLQAPVLDGGARFSFPTRHPLNFTYGRDILVEADLVIGLDVEDLFLILGEHVLEVGDARLRKNRPVTIAHITPAHYKLRSWAADYQRLPPVDRTISATADTGLRALLDACRRHPPAQDLLDARRSRLDGRTEALRRRWWTEADRADDADGIQPVRLAALLWQVIEGRPWTLVNGSLEGWEHRLWSFEGPRRHLGWHGGGGLGYGMGASVGATLKLGGERLCLNLQPDGDLLFTPSALWTAAHKKLPLLTVVYNNRQYRNSVDHAARLASERGRPARRKYVGTALDDPAIDFAAMARSFGIWATGPLTRSDDVVPALKEAIDVVERGQPALVDVVTVGS